MKTVEMDRGFMVYYQMMIQRSQKRLIRMLPLLAAICVLCLCNGALAAVEPSVVLFASAADVTPSPTPSPAPLPTPSPTSSPAPSPTSVLQPIVAGVASDEVQRAQLRLQELDYWFAPVSGVADEALCRALAVFLQHAPPNAEAASPDALFENDASVRAPAETGDTPAFVGAYAAGLPLTWDDVSQRLVPGEVYPLTLCASGIVFRMRFVEGCGHAELAPELSWDDATLYHQLNAHSGEKLPVVLSIGSLHIAASIACNPAAEPDADGMHRYCLYVLGSRSHVCGIPDAEHARVAAMAAGGADASDKARDSAAASSASAALAGEAAVISGDVSGSFSFDGTPPNEGYGELPEDD